MVNPDYTTDELEYIQQRNFLNLIYNFENELRYIQETGNCHPGITPNARKKLRRNRVLSVSGTGRTRAVKYSVSVEAATILKEMSKMTTKTPTEWASELAPSGRTVPEKELKAAQEVE